MLVVTHQALLKNLSKLFTASTAHVFGYHNIWVNLEEEQKRGITLKDWWCTSTGSQAEAFLLLHVQRSASFQPPLRKNSSLFDLIPVIPILAL